MGPGKWKHSMASQCCLWSQAMGGFVTLPHFTPSGSVDTKVLGGLSQPRIGTDGQLQITGQKENGSRSETPALQ